MKINFSNNKIKKQDIKQVEKILKGLVDSWKIQSILKMNLKNLLEQNLQLLSLVALLTTRSSGTKIKKR